MADPQQQDVSHGDMDHGFRDVVPLFLVPHEAALAGELSNGPFDNSASQMNASRPPIPGLHGIDCVFRELLLHPHSRLVINSGELSRSPKPQFFR